jgi:hypothetical protein
MRRRDRPKFDAPNRKDPTGFDYQAAMTEVIKNNPQIIEIINRTSAPRLIGSV